MARPQTRNVVTKETRRMAHEKFLVHADTAMETLVEIMTNDVADHGHRIAAAKEVLSRAYGQAPTFQNIVTETHKNDKPLISDEAIQALSDEDLMQYAGLIRKIVNAEENTVAAEISSED